MTEVVNSPEVLVRFNGALALIGPIARQVGRTVGPDVSISELESYGREGLLDASRRYDPTRRVPFRSYASLRIRGAIIDGVRELMPVSRRIWKRLLALEAMNRVSESTTEQVYETASAMTAKSADEMLGSHLAAMATAMVAAMAPDCTVGGTGELIANEEDGPEASLLRQELRQHFEEAIVELPAQEGALIRRHYLDGERFDQVAASLGLSKSWASRLHRRAIDRLAKRLKGIKP